MLFNEEKTMSSSVEYKEYKSTSSSKFGQQPNGDEPMSSPEDKATPKTLYTEALLNRDRAKTSAADEAAFNVSKEELNQAGIYLTFISQNAFSAHSIRQSAAQLNAALVNSAFNQQQAVLSYIVQAAQYGLSTLLDLQSGNMQQFSLQHMQQFANTNTNMSIMSAATNALLTTLIRQNSNGVLMMGKIEEWLLKNRPDIYDHFEQQGEKNKDNTADAQKDYQDKARRAQASEDAKKHPKKKHLLLTAADLIYLSYLLNPFIINALFEPLLVQSHVAIPTPSSGNTGIV